MVRSAALALLPPTMHACLSSVPPRPPDHDADVMLLELLPKVPPIAVICSL